jgi:hypothetical protein
MLVQDYLRDIKAVSHYVYWGGGRATCVVSSWRARFWNTVGDRPGVVFPGDCAAAPRKPGRRLFDVYARGESSFYQPEAHLKVMWGNVFVHSGHRKETRS